MEALTRAIEYANNSLHDGAGYWLVLTLTNGETVRGALSYITGQKAVRLDTADGALWVMVSHIVSARVEW